MDTVTIRNVTASDAPALLAIYAPYVEKTAITFEYDVPSLPDFSARIRRTLERYPYLAAEREGELIGYAYAGPFHERAAYDWCVETSIYLKMEERGRGVGTRLYAALEDALARQGVLNANACIAWPEQEDAYLTQGSVRFHEALGYRRIGQFHDCGFKFGRWYSMVWMEKLLGAHPAAPAPVVPYRSL